MNAIQTHVQPTKAGISPVWEPVPTFEVGRFLTVTGVVTHEGALSVEPGFHVDYRLNIPRPELSDEALREAIVLEFLDERKELLMHYAIPFAPVCAIGAADHGSNGAPIELSSARSRNFGLLIFAASVPYPPGYHFIRYHVGDRLLKEAAKPKDAPTVKFARTPDSVAADNEAISWEVVGPSEVDIRSIVVFSHDDGQSWQPVVPPSSKRSDSVPVCFANLPGGRARLKALATDGFSTATTECAPFDVPIKGVRPSILGPTEGAVVSAESMTWVHGQAYNYEKRDAAQDELLWCSSRDGELGRGAVIAARLSPGVHEVTLKCCESKVSITIVAKPDRRTGPPPLECDK
jgi:hypothetical protein